jgi:sugar/nucleoside kinase (ribokinase family)
MNFSKRPSREFDVIVAGELNIDLIFNKIEMFPETGKEVLAGQMILTLGSSSAIFASNLSSMGSKVAFAGMTGQDIFGDFILKSLEEKGVNTRFLLKSSDLSTGATVVINQAEDRAMLTYPGAMSDLTADEISDQMLASAGHLHVSSIFLQPGLRKGIVALMKRAKKSGLTTSLDTQWDPEEKWDLPFEELLPLIDVFLPNMQEFLNLSRSATLEAGIEKFASWLNILVVKEGSKGATLWHKGNLVNQPAFLNPEVADAIGAGDSFDAGFIDRYIHGEPLDECLKFAALMGAVNTTKPGGTAAFTNMDVIRQVARDLFRIVIG